MPSNTRSISNNGIPISILVEDREIYVGNYEVTVVNEEVLPGAIQVNPSLKIHVTEGMDLLDAVNILLDLRSVGGVRHDPV